MVEKKGGFCGEGTQSLRNRAGRGALILRNAPAERGGALAGIRQNGQGKNASLSIHFCFRSSPSAPQPDMLRFEKACIFVIAVWNDSRRSPMVPSWLSLMSPSLRPMASKHWSSPSRAWPFSLYAILWELGSERTPFLGKFLIVPFPLVPRYCRSALWHLRRRRHYVERLQAPQLPQRVRIHVKGMFCCLERRCRTSTRPTICWSARDSRPSKRRHSAHFSIIILDLCLCVRSCLFVSKAIRPIH